jgi:D-alanyl-D-alanine carboxypeptidase/D-alanyl-D-alanine-endopeptidase (penicillin-binding protein 4)
MLAAFTAASAPVARAEAPAEGRGKTLDASIFEAGISAIATDKIFKDATIGIEILDVETGKVLGKHNEHGLLNPASNAKVYTAACALATLHGSFRYQTTVLGNAKGANVDELVVRGFGDPSLETKDFVAFARELHAKGIRKVDGDILLDQRFFDDQTTPPAFEQQPNEWAAFRAPVSAIAVNENTVTLAVRPGKDGGNASFSFDPPGFVDVDGAIKTADGAADNVGLVLSASGKRLRATVSGAIGADSKVVRYTRRVEDPQLLAGYVFRAALEAEGIKVAGDVKLGGHGKTGVLAKHESAPLSSLLYALGKQSDNFYAEMIFKSISAEVRGRPAKSASSADLCQKWLDRHQLSDTGLVLKNGSGLFDANRVTAHSMVTLLRHAHRDASLQNEFLSQLAIGGVDGTLAKRFREFKAQRAVRAKTGTLDDVISLSGYVLGPPGRGPIAFSIMFNKVSGKGAGARAAADKLVELIAKESWRR